MKQLALRGVTSLVVGAIIASAVVVVTSVMTPLGPRRANTTISVDVNGKPTVRLKLKQSSTRAMAWAAADADSTLMETGFKTDGSGVLWLPATIDGSTDYFCAGWPLAMAWCELPAGDEDERVDPIGGFLVNSLNDDTGAPRYDVEWMEATDGPLSVRGSSRVIPHRPVALGAIANSLVFAAPVFLLLLLRQRRKA